MKFAEQEGKAFFLQTIGKTREMLKNERKKEKTMAATSSRLLACLIE